MAPPNRWNGAFDQATSGGVPGLPYRHGRHRHGPLRCSLTQLMDTVIGPAFQRKTGITYQGEDGLGGAVALARALRQGARRPDVFLSADGTQIDRLLMPPHGHWPTWCVPFARVTRVLTYSPLSQWRAEFERVTRGEAAWYDVLLQPGLQARLLGPDRNPTQIPPVEVLRRGLTTNELYATIAYGLSLGERGIPFVTLPAAVSLSDPTHAAGYARASFVTSDGFTLRGGLVQYTATVLADAPNPEAGAAFVAYVLSEEVQALLRQRGLVATAPTVLGAEGDVPPAVAAEISRAAAG